MLIKCLENAQRLTARALLPAGTQGSKSYGVAAPLPVWHALESTLIGGHEPVNYNRHSTAAVAGRIRSQVEFPLVPGTPYTLGGALLPSSQARVVTEVGPGNRLVHVNEAWEELCGFALSEVQGSCGLKFIQGPGTEASAVRKIQMAVEARNRVQVVLTNYKRNGQPFRNSLQITPLLGPTGQVSHLLGILRQV